MKCDENFINLKKDEPLRANAVNLVIFTNALCHFNATPLSVAVLAPYARSGNLACGGAWQGVVNLATHNTANSAWQMFAGEAGKAKMEQCLGGELLSLSLSLSLVARTFWHTFGLNLKGFFTHFVVVSSRFIVDFTHFIAILSRLIVNFSYFIVVLSHIFAYKRHFLGHCAFLKFSNALFLGFLRLSLCAVFVKIAWQSINLALPLRCGLPRSLCSLTMTDKENALYYFTMTADFVILSKKNE